MTARFGITKPRRLTINPLLLCTRRTFVMRLELHEKKEKTRLVICLSNGSRSIRNCLFHIKLFLFILNRLHCSCNSITPLITFFSILKSPFSIRTANQTHSTIEIPSVDLSSWFESQQRKVYHQRPFQTSQESLQQAKFRLSYGYPSNTSLWLKTRNSYSIIWTFKIGDGISENVVF